MVSAVGKPTSSWIIAVRQRRRQWGRRNRWAADERRQQIEEEKLKSHPTEENKHKEKDRSFGWLLLLLLLLLLVFLRSDFYFFTFTAKRFRVANYAPNRWQRRKTRLDCPLFFSRKLSYPNVILLLVLGAFLMIRFLLAKIRTKKGNWFLSGNIFKKSLIKVF